MDFRGPVRGLQAGGEVYFNGIRVGEVTKLSLDARDPNTLVPELAESWSVSADGKTYTFKMRAGAKWSDGSPVVAGDFVYAWQRLVDPATAAEYAYMLAPVANAEDVTAGKKKPAELGIKAVDDMTLEVTLNAPTPYFIEMLTHQATYPINKANVEKL